MQEPGQLEGGQHPPPHSGGVTGLLGGHSAPPDTKTQQTPAWRDPTALGSPPGVPTQSQGRFMASHTHSVVCLSHPSLERPHSTGDPTQGAHPEPGEVHGPPHPLWGLSQPSQPGREGACPSHLPGCVCSHLTQLWAGMWGRWKENSPSRARTAHGESPGKKGGINQGIVLSHPWDPQPGMASLHQPGDTAHGTLLRKGHPQVPPSLGTAGFEGAMPRLLPAL